jgi:hypothetical protein
MLNRLIFLLSFVFVLGLADSSSADLAAHWKFDNDGSDSVGLLNWKLENGAGYSTDCKEGSHSLKLDGIDDCAVQTAVGALAEAFSAKTIALWFKVDSNNVTQVLYDEGGASNGLGIRINEDYLQAAVRNAGVDVIASAGLDSTGWTHAAVTFDNGSLRLYINGKEQASASAKFTQVGSHTDAAGIGVRNSQDAFGKRGTGDYFGGLIDDVRIYDNALSADEIKEMTAVRPVKEIVPPEPESEQPEAKPEKAEPEKPKPEEPKPEKPKPKKPTPSKSTTVPERLQRRITYNIGPEIYYFKYKEPGYMKEDGIFYGATFSATYRKWISDSSGKVLSDSKMMVRGEGRFAVGQVDYDGASIDLMTGETTPFSTTNDDFTLESRLLLGPEWLIDDTLSTIFAGIGYRYLNDDLAADELGGYERESNYYYVPIGFEIDADLREGWSWTGRIEYDYFLWGVQRSHIFPTIIENDQDSGYGYRASVKLQKRSENINFVIEPFFRYWDIDDSDYEYIFFHEPPNNTTEYGIQLMLMF